MGAQQAARLGDGGIFGLVRGLGQAARNRARQIDGRKPPAFRDLSIQHHMPIQHPAQDVGHGFLHIRARDQNGEQRGDIAHALRARPAGSAVVHPMHAVLKSLFLGGTE